MNTLSIFNPLFTDSLFNVLEKQSSGFTGLTHSVRAFYPAIDVRETAHAYSMEIDLPGYTENDVSVDIKDRVLTIASTHTEKHEEKNETEEESFLIRERVHKAFVRRFTLPEDSNREEIDAAFKNGILTVTIPRVEEAAQRQINIKVS